jgi:hypothetical protein
MKPGLKDKNPKNPKYHFCFFDTKNRQRYEYNPEQAGIHALSIKPSYLKVTKFSTLL